MKSKLIVLILSKIIITCSPLLCQDVIPATGGSADGTGGSATYTIGQLGYSFIPGTNSFVIQGVQQPYEVSTVTAIENTGDILLECYVYPNPADHIIRLVIGSVADGDFRYQLWDMNAKIIKDKEISNIETEISVTEQPAGIFFLKIIRNNHEVKVFKIVKR